MAENPAGGKRSGWSYLGSILSVLAGCSLIVLAYLLVKSGSLAAMLIGGLNGWMALGLLELAGRLILQRKGIYQQGLAASLRPAGLVLAQVFFLLRPDSMLSSPLGIAFDGQTWDNIMRALEFFFVLDLALVGVILLSSRNYITELQPHDVPESSPLLSDLQDMSGISAEERDVLLETRRRFIAYKSATCKGGIEVNQTQGGLHIDLVVTPLGSYAGRGGRKAYTFHSILTPEQVKAEKGAVDHIIAISACDDALRESEKGWSSVGIYLLRDGLRTSSDASDFDEFAKESFGLRFRHFYVGTKRPVNDQTSPVAIISARIAKPAFLNVSQPRTIQEAEDCFLEYVQEKHSKAEPISIAGFPGYKVVVEQVLFVETVDSQALDRIKAERNKWALTTIVCSSATDEQFVYAETLGLTLLSLDRRIGSSKQWGMFRDAMAKLGILFEVSFLCPPSDGSAPGYKGSESNDLLMESSSVLDEELPEFSRVDDSSLVNVVYQDFREYDPEYVLRALKEVRRRGIQKERMQPELREFLYSGRFSSNERTRAEG